MRREYDDPALDVARLPDEPMVQFQRWFDAAVDAGVEEPNAMVLATVDTDGRPRQRTVLLKGYDARGFVFYTNYESAKAAQITHQPWVSLLFGWYRAHRQVIVSGTVARVDREETERYFATRPRGAQLEAWASAQSRQLTDRDELERSWARAAERFDGGDVPAPPHWGGFRVEPGEIEFWQGRRDRMHDRLRYIRRDSGWGVVRLSP